MHAHAHTHTLDIHTHTTTHTGTDTEIDIDTYKRKNKHTHTHCFISTSTRIRTRTCTVQIAAKKFDCGEGETPGMGRSAQKSQAPRCTDNGCYDGHLFAAEASRRSNRGQMSQVLTLLLLDDEGGTDRQSQSRRALSTNLQMAETRWSIF